MVFQELEGAAGLIATLDNAPKGIGRQLRAALVKVGLGLVGHMKSNELSGQSLKVRTGTGRRSVTYRVYEEGSDIVVVAGPDLRKAPYMRAQDKGATIVPKRSRYLTVPVGEALTAKGVARFSARDLINSPAAFGYVGTFVHNRVIFGKKKDGSIYPLFALKDSVKLKAVGYMANTLNEKRAWAERVLSDAVGDGLK
jgi:hypothetical protein